MKTATPSKQSKLAQYTAVAGALIAGSNVNAQIVYTDVSPDAVLDSLSAPYMLDFNNDANPDLIFSVQHLVGAGSTSGIQFTYVGDGCVVGFPAGNQVIVSRIYEQWGLHRRFCHHHQLWHGRSYVEWIANTWSFFGVWYPVMVWV